MESEVYTESLTNTTIHNLAELFAKSAGTGYFIDVYKVQHMDDSLELAETVKEDKISSDFVRVV